MKDKLFDLAMSNILIIIVFIVLIPVVHFLKKLIKDENVDRKSLKVIGLSFLSSFILNFLPAFAYCTIASWMDFIIYILALTLIIPVCAGGVTVLFDKLINAGVVDAGLNWLKNFLNGGKK
jgi:hypothetical protein